MFAVVVFIEQPGETFHNFVKCFSLLFVVSLKVKSTVYYEPVLMLSFNETLFFKAYCYQMFKCQLLLEFATRITKFCFENVSFCRD